MFNKDDQNQTIKEVETIVGHSVKIKGDLHGKGNIVVEGEMEGSLISENKLFIKEKAKVKANINAKDAVVGGEVMGNIYVEGYLEITATAIINGDVQASILSIEKGGQLNGNCTTKHIQTIKKSGQEVI